MPNNKKPKPYTEIDRDSYDYDRLIEKIAQVTKISFAANPEFDARQSAIELVDTYEEVMLVFWNRQQVQEVLDRLKRNLADITSAYGSLPTLVAEDLKLNATVCDDLRYDKFLKKTDLDVIFANMKPARSASIAIKALEPLAVHCSGLIEAIEMTRRELPQGMVTKNRQSFNQWALIEATVRLVRRYNAMNIPNSMDQSGPLHKLLKEVFEIFGIKKNSFKRVFESWQMYIDGKLESYDLPSI